MIGVAVQMDIEDVSPLVAGRICKLCVCLREIGIVAGDEQGLGKLVLRPPHPEGLLGDAAVIIEYRDVTNLNRKAVKGDEPPWPILVVRPAGVIGLSDVGTVADGTKRWRSNANCWRPALSFSVPPPTGSVNTTKACSRSSRFTSTG